MPIDGETILTIDLSALPRELSRDVLRDMIAWIMAQPIEPVRVVPAGVMPGISTGTFH